METKVVKHRELVVAIIDNSPYQATGEVYKRCVKIELTEEQAQRLPCPIGTGTRTSTSCLFTWWSCNCMAQNVELDAVRALVRVEGMAASGCW